MRRVLVILVLLVLAASSAVVAVVAADWPFWQRAWRWHQAGPAGPARVPGAWRWIGHGDGIPWAQGPMDPSTTEALAALIRGIPTDALLVARAGQVVAELYGDGVRPESLLQGGSMTSAVLAPLYGIARRGGVDVLDAPLRRLLPDYDTGLRGDITPRQLLWQVSGLESPGWRPLDPFSAQARLLSGPNFARAARDFRSIWPPGSHFETSPANAQLAALVLVSVTGRSFADLVESGLWDSIGAGRAKVTLDRLAGEMSAHCCLSAKGRDWLRLANFYARDDAQGLWPAGFLRDEVTRATAVHPAYGLGLEIETLDDGTVLLWAGAAGRWMLAVPARQLAVVWLARQEVTASERGRLKALLGFH